MRLVKRAAADGNVFFPDCSGEVDFSTAGRHLLHKCKPRYVCRGGAAMAFSGTAVGK